MKGMKVSGSYFNYPLYHIYGTIKRGIFGIRRSKEKHLDEQRTLCVMGVFDGEANREVKRLKDILTGRGITPDSQEPHMTFGIYTGLDDGELLGWIGKAAAKQESLKISLNHFGFFPDSRYCFLAPGITKGLMELHGKIHEKYDNYCTDKGCLYSLREKAWVPHMTLAAIEPGQEEALLTAMWEGFKPFTAEIGRLKVTSSDMEEEMGEFGLGG